APLVSAIQARWASLRFPMPSPRAISSPPPSSPATATSRAASRLGQVRVWLGGADFVRMMGWLQGLSAQYPIDVSQLSADRAQGEGQVNARVTLRENA
ncbi:MAG: type II secretion system protein GspM, partial [Pseudomonadota bacterium]